LRAQLHSKADPAKAEIFAAHAELLDDPDFLDIASSAIAKGKSAAFAWKSAAQIHAERLASLRNELLAQRANDVRDVGGRVLELLTGVTHKPPTYPEGSILIAEDLTPSDTATMDREHVVGFATVRGGSTSHVAILARSLAIPAKITDSPIEIGPSSRQRRTSAAADSGCKSTKTILFIMRRNSVTLRPILLRLPERRPACASRLAHFCERGGQQEARARQSMRRHGGDQVHQVVPFTLDRLDRNPAHGDALQILRH